MRGAGQYSILKQNINATSADTNTKRWMNKHKQMCWRCQKDKSTYGGNVDMLGGRAKGVTAVKRFICADCVAERATLKAEKETT